MILLTPTKALTDLSGVGIDWTGNSGVFAEKIKSSQSELGVDAIVDLYTASINRDLYLCYINEEACTTVASELRGVLLSMSETEEGGSPETSDVRILSAAIASAAALAGIVVLRKSKMG